MINHKRKEKLIKLKESGLTADELRTQMAEMQVPQADADALIVELYDGAGAPPVPPIPPESPAKQKSGEKPAETPAEQKRFDYENLTRGEFEEYDKHVASLDLHKMRDFEVYKVESVIEDRYPGLPNTPRDMIGIRITNNKPLHTTRVAPRTALEMNAQVRNTGRYYLLKQ